MLKVIILFFMSAFLNTSCTNIVKKAELGECLQHKYESGTFMVKKKSDDELLLEELKPTGHGPLKTINGFYGGWIKVPCPEKI